MSASARHGLVTPLTVALVFICGSYPAGADPRQVSALDLPREASSVSPFPLRTDAHSSPITIGDLNGDGTPELAQVDYRYISDRAGSSYYGGPTTVHLAIHYSPFLPGQTSREAGFTAHVTQTARRQAFGDVDLVRDVSGDRIPDVVVTDTFWPRTRGHPEAGAAWIIFGRIDGSTVRTGETPGWGYSITGAGDGAFLGEGVAGGRDVSGDGIGDLVISAGGNASRNRARVSYVVFGKPIASDVDLAVPGGWGYRISGTTGSNVGLSADTNADGRSEVLVSRGGGGRDRVLVLLAGKDSVEDDSVSRPLLTVTGQGGPYLSDSGDMNGDGRGDLVLVARGYGSSPVAVPSRSSPIAHAAPLIPPPTPGGVFVVFGGAAPRSLNLNSMTPGEGYVIRGADAPDTLDVARIAGDFNGDGRPELVISAPGAGRNCRGGPSAYVVLSGVGTAPLRLGDPGERALRLDAGRHETWLAPLPSGDVDGDGRADLLAYAEQAARRSPAEDWKPVAARLYAVLGRSSLPPPADRTPPRAKIVLERNREPTVKSLLARGFIRTDVTLTEPARARLTLDLSTPKRTYRRLISRRLRLEEGLTTGVRLFVDRRARRKLRAAAAEIHAAARELTAPRRDQRRARGRSAVIYPPIARPHAVLYARVRLVDNVGNRCDAWSGIFGSIYLF